MKILMLGHSGAGKTTYMASMYGHMHLCHDPQQTAGFSLRAVDAETGVELLQSAEAIRQGWYPAGTCRRASYDFDLCHSGKALFRFTWVDIRGGVLVERSDDSPQAKELLADLTSCDGILVFCDTPKLAEDGDACDELDRISQLIGRATGRRSSEKVPLVLAFSKSDLVASLNGRAIRAVSGLRAMASRGERVVATEVHVSCGGLAKNVHVPALFLLAHGLQARIDRLDRERRQLEQQKADHQAEVARRREENDSLEGMARNFWGWWKERPWDTPNARLQWAREQLARTGEELTSRETQVLPLRPP